MSDRDVYEALLEAAYLGANTRVVVLDPECYWGTEGWLPADRPRNLPIDAWQSFMAGLEEGGTLPRDMNPGVPIAWFSNAEFRELPQGDFATGAWAAFHERFPGNSGYISLSRVGYSADRRIAVVHGFVGSGMLSASGDLFVLRHTSAGWRLVTTKNCAIA